MSLCLVPPILRPLRARSLLDLLFGRIRLVSYVHAPGFVDLCRAHGLKVGFIKKKQTNRLRSSGQLNGYPVFDGRALGYMVGDLLVVMGSAKIHEMVFNWVRPMSIVQELVEVHPLLKDPADLSFTGDYKQPFSEADLEFA